jgi:hypothetical protein
MKYFRVEFERETRYRGQRCNAAECPPLRMGVAFVEDHDEDQARKGWGKSEVQSVTEILKDDFDRLKIPKSKHDHSPVA